MRICWVRLSPPSSVVELVVAVVCTAVGCCCGDCGIGANGLSWATATGAATTNAASVRKKAGAIRAFTGRESTLTHAPPQQRQIRVEQSGALVAMQQLESRSDEELEAEQKNKAAALAILGARASE